MSDKELHKILSDKLKEHSSPVPDSVWQGVSSSLGSAASSAAAAGLSTLAKVFIAAAFVGAATTAYMVLSPSEEATILSEQVEEVPVSSSELNESEEADGISEELTVQEVAEEPVVAEQPQEVSHSNEVGATKRSDESPTQSTQESQGVTLPAAPETLNAEERKAIESAQIEASPIGGPSPLEVHFSSNVSAEQIKWNFGDGSEEVYGLTPVHVYAESGSYVVSMIAKTADGAQMDQMTIEVREEQQEQSEEQMVQDLEIDAPNIFTPNFDGQNDVFEVDVEGVIEYSLTIYDPAGAKVFETNNPSEAWDGRDLSGLIVAEGTYFYVIMAIGEDQRSYAKRGYVALRK